ncbi:MAG: 16S rRNA (adenine(1518)-N(6)/adenine(1519)-N(6))-dimethyltransferase RsmA [Candidatus Omnitrophota bacterium]
MNLSNIKPKYRLGQNFLIDNNVLNRIVTSCGFEKDDQVLEIGAGLGALTRNIAPIVGKVFAVETDRQLCEELKKNCPQDNIDIIHADFLKYNLSLLPDGLKAIGNLPYYISSPIVGKIVEYRKKFISLSITVQLEFGNRMVALPSTKDYSAFSCFVQYYTVPKILFKIKNSCFRPKPKVDSCFLDMQIRKSPLHPAKNEELLWKIVHAAFGQRRKVITNSLLPVIPKEKLLIILESLKLAPSLRAENLSIKDFVDITNLCSA